MVVRYRHVAIVQVARERLPVVQAVFDRLGRGPAVGNLGTFEL
jgi:hypothetical protein